MPDIILDGPGDARVTLLLAPGAGVGPASLGMTAIAGALATEGLRVARWDFAFRASARPPPRAETLVPEVAAAIEALEARDAGRPVVIGGKSMGGRVASLAADALHAVGRIAGLLCLGYPFHPPGRPERPRTAHLAALETPTLIVQGTRDPFGTPDEVATYALSPTIEFRWLEDGDHDLKPRKRLTGLSHADHLAAMAAHVAAWSRGLL
jgi:uncharacterized protein